MLTEEPGWIGVFTRAVADGAWPNGTRVVKAHSDPGDAMRDGACGTVLGSLSHAALGRLYFIEWDAAPRFAVACVEFKLRTTGT